MKKQVLVLLVSMICFLFSGCGAEQEEHTFGLFAMGTYMDLTAYGENAEAALDDAGKRIVELEKLWSVTDENSEIYRANHSQGKPSPISPETEELLRFTLEISKQTEGALDPTIYPLVNAWGFIDQNYRVPDEQTIQRLLQNSGFEKVTVNDGTVTLPKNTMLDFGAVGKGYTGETLAQLLKSQGVSSALLNIGGNVQLVGKKPDGSRWRLGIQNPFGEGSFGVLAAEDCAVVTSGGYERYFTGANGETYWHILDPATGKPADSGLASVTIIAKNGKLCDALSTAVFVMGLEKSADYWSSRRNFDMLLMTQTGDIYLTEGIVDDFILEESFMGQEIHVIQ